MMNWKCMDVCYKPKTIVAQETVVNAIATAIQWYIVVTIRNCSNIKKMEKTEFEMESMTSRFECVINYFAGINCDKKDNTKTNI